MPELSSFSTAENAEGESSILMTIPSLNDATARRYCLLQIEAALASLTTARDTLDDLKADALREKADPIIPYMNLASDFIANAETTLVSLGTFISNNKVSIPR